MTTKDTNPKDAIGVAKVPQHVISRPVLAELGLAMMEGGRKYGTHNWRVAGIRASVYYDAMMRHVDAFWEGQDIDPDSGVCHLTKAMACLMILRDSMMLGNWVDDRPPKFPDGNWVAKMNAQAKELIAKYPVSADPYTELDTN